jgi:hypothetical protein
LFFAGALKLLALFVSALWIGALFVSATLPAHAADKQFFWKVTSPGAGATTYLLGSVHFGDESMYPLAQVIRDAFAASDALVVEINSLDLDPLSAAALFAEKGMYNMDGSKLQSEIQTGTWQSLLAAAERYGLTPELLQLQRPWLVALSLSALEFKRAGFSESLGVDQHFLRQAQGVKPILELESLSEQIGIFESFSSVEQEAFLIQTLADLERGATYLRELLGAWQAGDAQGLNSLINESFQSSPFDQRVYQMLFVNRNLAMTRKIEDMMSSGQTHFVVVGAGHLVGEQGIVQMMRQKGYAVEQL